MKMTYFTTKLWCCVHVEKFFINGGNIFAFLRTMYTFNIPFSQTLTIFTHHSLDTRLCIICISVACITILFTVYNDIDLETLTKHARALLLLLLLLQVSRT